ncbi:hypothetical protein ASE71_19625 [Ensifer sp. Root954]|nr:hypothetical protein ASD49_25150 [Ensifer sp. Root1298]KQX90937.1 hypothetical protein ASD41_23840 [Ensifer sp. Root1312]KRC25781.1 hypothetical protein ASE29_22300 [Ensifer sp. Root74]KRD73661.1 hypothetical protein ASE71_19625 [Ensifer sp. Root954]
MNIRLGATSALFMSTKLWRLVATTAEVVITIGLTWLIMEAVTALAGRPVAWLVGGVALAVVVGLLLRRD